MKEFQKGFSLIELMVVVGVAYEATLANGDTEANRIELGSPGRN